MKELQDPHSQRVVLAVPPGLEVACIRIARRETGIRFDRIAEGLLQSKERASDACVAALLDNAPVWTFGSFREVAKLRSLDAGALDQVCEALKTVVGAAGWEGQSYWLTAPKGEPQRWAKHVLAKDFGLVNNPGSYTVTLKIASDGNASYVLLGRSISVKTRFAYRVEDVGASINPVLAACLGRLLPQELSGCSIDPTCGSGTLLFERLRYSQESRGLGIDRSPVAQRAFHSNLDGAGLDGRKVRFQLGDASDGSIWTPCSSVVCNLPFGIRVKEKTEDLDALYFNILDNARCYLSGDGRVLMTSSYKRGLDNAAARIAQHLKLLSRYRCEMGGLFYHVFVFGRE